MNKDKLLKKYVDIHNNYIDKRNSIDKYIKQLKIENYQDMEYNNKLVIERNGINEIIEVLNMMIEDIQNKEV